MVGLYEQPDGGTGSGRACRRDLCGALLDLDDDAARHQQGHVTMIALGFITAALALFSLARLGRIAFEGLVAFDGRAVFVGSPW